MENAIYLHFSDLEVYKLSRHLSAIAWSIYKDLPQEYRYSIGRQFIESTDSTGANIAEGYGRFHYLDRIKFLYNSRGSLLESLHWIDLLFERNLIDSLIFEEFKNIAESLRIKLNSYIKAIYAKKSGTS